MILQELEIAETAESQNLDFIRDIISKAFWAWYLLNTTRRLSTVRWWILHKTFIVSDLKPIFELIFGPPKLI